MGAKNKDRWDLALAAMARVYGLVLVTRNVTDFEGEPYGFSIRSKTRRK
ncbi:hypothetical protein [Bradyrhizobium elkanii]|nr:hypothetical protein [Bradyrhizobium elkanii]MCS3695071.1 hypothetical protein [Bradyrhizobium elkanii]